MASNPHARANPAERALKREKAFGLKAEGMSDRDIALALGVGKTTAQTLVREACVDLVAPAIEHYRQVMDAQLDDLQQRVMSLVHLGENSEAGLKAVDRVLRIMDRRARLWGLDAPERADVTVHQVTAEDVELTALINEAKAKAAVEEAQLRGVVE